MMNASELTRLERTRAGVGGENHDRDRGDKNLRRGFNVVRGAEHDADV